MNAKPWDVDHKETDNGDGRYDYYFVMNGEGKVVCDSSNSDVQEIHTEDDENGSYSWDEQGKKDLTRLVECRNAMAGVPDPAAFMSAVDAVLNYKFPSTICHDIELTTAIQSLRSARGKH